MTSFQQQDFASHNSGVTYEIINNYALTEPTDLKMKLKRNYNIIVYLVLSAILCFATAFLFNGLMRRFDKDNCILDTHIVFIYKTVEFLNASDVVVQQPEDEISIDNIQIDHTKTSWSQHQKCDTMTYPPLIIGFFAVIWATMFYVCSMTSKHNRSLLPNPWRIVSPALVFFIAMVIWAFCYCVYSSKALAKFCKELSSFESTNLTTTDNCGQLVNVFGHSPPYSMSPMILFYSYRICSFAMLIIWTYISILLLIRLLFGTDFRHSKLQIKPFASKKIVELQSLSGKIEK